MTPGNRTESLGKGMRGSLVVLPLLEPIVGYGDAWVGTKMAQRSSGL